MNPILRAAFALLLFFVVAPAIARADAVPATVAYVKGDATVIDPAGHSQKVIVEMQLAPGSTVIGCGVRRDDAAARARAGIIAR